MAELVWAQLTVITWTQLLLDSYKRLLGRDLLERSVTATEQAKALFFAPFVVVSHGTEEDPILNYGNQMALELWQTEWESLICTPSRLTAEPVHQAEREQMLSQLSTQGFIDNYRCVRISSKRQRFLIEEAIVWNIVDAQDKRYGQAATFSRWSLLPQNG
jgi:hypothetical protein